MPSVGGERLGKIEYSHLPTSSIGTLPLVFILNHIGVFGLFYVSSHSQDLYGNSR